jgi:hypothetical protein
MGSVVNDIGSVANDIGKTAVQSIGNAIGKGSSQTSIPGVSMPNLGGDIAGFVGDMGTGLSTTLKGIVAGGSPVSGSPSQSQPATPKADPAAIGAQQAQLSASAQYQQNLPMYQQQMAERLSQNANKQTAQQQRSIESKNSARGLGYGALNEGMKAQDAAANQQQLAGQIAGGNQGLLDLGQGIQSGAIQTGLGIQNDLQQRQNQIYQQQLATAQANNSQTNSGLGLLATAAMFA